MMAKMRVNRRTERQSGRNLSKSTIKTKKWEK